MRGRREYPLRVTFNGRTFNRVVIDQHYRLRHAESINDELILELVRELDGDEAQAEVVDGDFSYHARRVYRDFKAYRLILVISSNDDFLGVVNAFRV